MQTSGRDVAESTKQERWRSRMNPRTSGPGPHRVARTSESEQGEAAGHTPADAGLRHSLSTAATTGSNALRQIIGNYELGRVLATGDFDCRTRLCTHVTTGVPFVARIYDKHVLAEAQWMWDRVAESIHVQRKLPRNKHILEMVECFESNTSVYIVMHLFPSMNLTKLFTDEAAKVELLNRLHILSRATLRASAAARDARFSGGLAHSKDQGGIGIADGNGLGLTIESSSNNNSATSITFSERPPFRQLKDSRQSGSYDASDGEGSARLSPQHANEKRGGSASIFPDDAGVASIATAAAIQALEGVVPPHIPLALVRVLFEQAVKGIAFLHQHGVAHTGIAPDHLLVSPDGLLRLGNMVSSCFCEPGERLHELRGTIHTVAPEVLRGEAYDPFLSDAWALGVVFFFMLNRGRYPHDGANTLRHILHGRTRQPRPGIPAVALDLLSRLMQARPENRLPVDAVLAHPFFTAALPTVEEEMAADAADELARTGRRSVHTVYGSSSHKGSDSRPMLFEPQLDGSTSTRSKGARGGGNDYSGRRWIRGMNGVEEYDPDALTGSWSTPHQHLPPAIFSVNSASNSVVMAGGMSSTFDTIDGISALSATGDALAAAAQERGRGEGNASLQKVSSSGVFIPQRAAVALADGRRQRTSASPHPAGASDIDASDFRSRVVAAGSPRKAQSPTPTRPVWRPELASSMDALEDLAARVIQYHFRNALHSRQYKAETWALMQQGQSMYLAGTSSTSSRDGQTSESAQQRSSQRTHRSPSLSNHATYPHDASTDPRSKVPRRLSTTRSAAVIPPMTTLSPPVRKRKASFHPSHDSALSSSAPASSSAHARGPSMVGFHDSAGRSGSGGHTAHTPSRGRSNNSGTVTIDTRTGSAMSDNAEWKAVDDDDADEKAAMERYVMTPAKRRGSVNADCDNEAGTPSVKPMRTASLSVPSLAATAMGIDWAGDAPPPQRPQGTSNRAIGSVVNTTLLSQQHRRRSTISAVLSSVAPGRGSVDRQRNGGSAVPDGEVCPLCHREPYAIRSIAIRPYAATPYQFTGGTFTKLLE